jgi:hypothetical protein
MKKQKSAGGNTFAAGAFFFCPQNQRRLCLSPFPPLWTELVQS